MVRLRDSWPFSLSSAPTVGNPCRPLQPESVSVTIAVAIRLTSRVIETTTEIMALLLRVGSSLAMDNAAKALQFPNVAASLNRIEHQPSKLRVAGRALPRSPA